MANSNQARKRARQLEQRRKHKMSQRSVLRSRIQKVIRALDANDKEAAQAAFKEAVPVIDRMTGRRIIHRNAAARQKSQLNTRIKALD